MHRSTPMGSPGGLARYGSAPGSLLASLAESVMGSGGGGGYSGVVPEGMMSRFFPGESSCMTSESTCNASAAARSPDAGLYRRADGGSAGGGGAGHGPVLQRSYGAGGIPTGDPTAGGSSKGGALMRHSSSPAGFFSDLIVDNEFTFTRGIEAYSQSGLDGSHAMTTRILESQLSFSKQDSLPQISEIRIPDIRESVGGGKSSVEVAGQSYISSSFPVASWDDSNSIMFSTPPSNRVEDSNGDIITTFSNIESQFFQPKISLEMASVEKYLEINQDSVPFKVRAKRGCATHPRSIAERERRTRISEKLRKLQELVPNMDKQTSTADMLDLAVDHIKGLQIQVQKLNAERANCTCEASRR